MAKFFRTEMENTWGQKHLAVFDEVEAWNWGKDIPFTIRPSMTSSPFDKVAT